MENDDLSERLNKIRESVNRINKLMNEMRGFENVDNKKHADRNGGSHLKLVVNNNDSTGDGEKRVPRRNKKQGVYERD